MLCVERLIAYALQTVHLFQEYSLLGLSMYRRWGRCRGSSRPRCDMRKHCMHAQMGAQNLCFLKQRIDMMTSILKVCLRLFLCVITHCARDFLFRSRRRTIATVAAHDSMGQELTCTGGHPPYPCSCSSRDDGASLWRVSLPPVAYS